MHSRLPFAVVLVLLARLLAAPALAQGVASCRIVSVDTVSMSFLCRSNGGVTRYWVTRATTFQTRGPRASFFDVRTGERVRVISHAAGRLLVADVVAD